MFQLIRRWFLQHPREKGMTYTQHAVHSLGFSAKFAMASLQSLTHAVIPALFTDTTTKLNEQLTRSLKKGASE